MRFITGVPRLLPLALLGMLIGFVPVQAAWRVRVPGSSTAGPLAVDSGGDVFAAVGFPQPHHGIGVAIVNLAAEDGVQRWRRRLRGAGLERSDFVYALQATATGDVVAGGSIENEGYATFFLTRLSGRDGRPQWRRIIHGLQRRSEESVSALALDAVGDIIAAGGLEGGTTNPYRATEDFAVVKLAHDTGVERWRFTFDGSADDFDYATGIAVDAAGDVIAAGVSNVTDSTNSLGYRRVVTVIKLTSADGHLLWHQDIDAAVNTYSVAVDGNGDALIAVDTAEPNGNDFGVFKLAGTNGHILWSARESGSDGHWQEAFQVTALPSGDVAAVGFTTDARDAPSLTTVVLDNATGAERWRRLLQGNDGYGVGRALAVSPQGDVLVGGQLRNRGTCYDIAVAKLAASTGDVLTLHRMDGRSTASQCDRPECDAPRSCGPPRAGIDRDDLTALAIDHRGRAVVAGALSDGPRGQQHGVVATFPAKP